MSAAGMRVTICVLCYGDFAVLAERCLTSIRKLVFPHGQSQAVELKVGLNMPGKGTEAVCDSLCREFSALGVPAAVYRPAPPDMNAFKYPLMRRMFYDAQRPLADWAMWFDDDSYYAGENPQAWWTELQRLMSESDVLGQLWYMPNTGNRWEWVKAQPWFNPSVGLPSRHSGKQICFKYPQGAWWLARSSLLQRLQWPAESLRHNGGDSFFGEACRHVHAKMTSFHMDMCINRGQQGEKTAPRRGHSEPRCGVDFGRVPVSLAHHAFTHTVTDYADGNRC